MRAATAVKALYGIQFEKLVVKVAKEKLRKLIPYSVMLIFL